ncbi:MAG: WS/DGAT/MGAT family O-acyltransferase [Panacagrimonas sp.]
MKKLTALDLGFIFLEKRNQPLHVASLNLLRPPADAPPDFVQKLVERMRSYAAPLAPFNQRLESRFGAAYWVEDLEFDIDQHVIHLALPKPGRIRELLAMVSRMHASHLDRAYPLWRTYVIEGLEGGRIATYSKVHHSVADGVAGTRLMLKSMSADPDEVVPPTWAVPARGRRERAPSLLTAPVTGAAKLAGRFSDAFGSLPAITRELRQSVREMREKHPDFVSGFAAPPSILNRRISASRRFAAQSYSLIRAKAAGKALGCTVNDVALAMCSHALRKYLLELDALPDKPLIAAVPMSTRRDHSESGNQLAFMLANLGTHQADPAERLRCIRGSIEHSKRRFMKMKPGEILGYGTALMAPGLLNMVASSQPKWLAFNLVISNVPGPRSQVYWMGCKLEGMYPVSVVADGMALNITLASRDDSLDFGVIACRRTLPHVQVLIDYLGEGLAELEALAGTVA